jgi:drug/metabolite transporter (DMT)-like permease
MENGIQEEQESTELSSSQSKTPFSDTSEDNDDDRNRKLLGTMVLLSVPLSWGTYSPVVRYLYEIQPPVPGFVFSACYYALAAITTLVLAHVQSAKVKTQPSSSMRQESTVASFRGGLELGSYLFVANCLQVIGLQTVQAERAGFLVQLTTVMVPLTEALLAASWSKVPLRTYMACLLALAGLVVMGLDGKDMALSGDTSLGAISSFSQGDVFILGAAVLYTLHVVRLGVYAKETTPMKLAAAKATTETVLSVGLVAALVGLSSLVVTTTDSNGLIIFAATTGREITSFFESFSTGVADGSVALSALLSALGAIFWTGWITCAYTIWAQSYGQSRVSPTNANLVYTFQPIFTALFAWALLGETMGPAGFAGGAIIATAVYTVATSSGSDE